MILSNPPQLSVGICDMLWAGHPSPLPPPPVDSIHMLKLLRNAGLGGKLNRQRCPLQNAFPRVLGEGQPLSWERVGSSSTCSSLEPAGQGQLPSA